MRKQLLTLAAAGALAFGAQSANATLMLSLDDGNTSKTIVDETTDDGMNGLPGYVTYSALDFGGATTPWSITTATGLGNPVIGTDYYDALHLDSLEVSSGGPGTLTVMLTNTDMTRSPASFAGGLGGYTAGNVDFQLYASSVNDAFGKDVLLYDSATMSGNFSDSLYGGIDFAAPYSLTMVATITHDGDGQRTSFDFDVTVPTPATVALFGVGLLAMGFAARRRQQDAA